MDMLCCEKGRNNHRTFASKAVAGVFTVFATGRYTVASAEKIPCRKYFMRLIFVALCNYEIFQQQKISQFTVAHANS